MSRKRRDIIPTATSQLVPKLAYSGVVQENIAESSQKGKKVPSIPPHKLVSTMDLWGGSRTAQSNVFRGQNSNGTCLPQSLPNQESESRFSWWIQHSDGPSWNRIYLLRARTGEITTKRWLNRRNNAQHTRNRIRRHVTCNDRMWTAPITKWTQKAFKIQRLGHVKKHCSCRTRFRGYVKSRLLI